MENLNRKHTAPIPVNRSKRRHSTRAITSLPAGKMVPIAAVPLLREDSVSSGQYNFVFEMSETAEILMNQVNVRVMAYLVPWLAFERFGGSMDFFNKSWNGQPPMEGEAVIPFIERDDFMGGTENDEPRDVYTYLGLHAKPDALVNTMYLESYNAIWNHRAANRSRDITPRDRLADDLAPAFWLHETFAHVVPDFDQASMDGNVALNVVEAKMPIRGIGLRPLTLGAASVKEIQESSGDLVERDAWDVRDRAEAPSEGQAHLRVAQGVVAGVPDIYAELQENGITVSLANIELARKTQAFAKLRRNFEGHTDDDLIDMLMSGLSVPDQALKQPILLGDARGVFGMAKRYASDSGNLTESVVNGVASASIRVRVPKLSTGGVIMFVAEVTPEQLFERQKDPFLHAESKGEFPDYLRDVLDPEKVTVVANDYVDIDHNTPNDTFGYAPLNFQWNRTAPNIGGRFYRPQVDAAFDEDRQRFWAVETENPTLSEDFYLCTAIHQKPFVDTTSDPFECVAVGEMTISGNTVFGPALIEASDNYDKIMEKAPTDRIEKAE